MIDVSNTKEVKVVSDIETVNSLLSSGNWKIGKILEGTQSIEFLMLYFPEKEEKTSIKVAGFEIPIDSQKEEEKVSWTYPFNTDYKEGRRRVNEFQKMVRELVRRELNVKK